MSRIGRPRKNNSKIRQYRLRLTDEEANCMEYLREKTGLSMADILRKGVDMQYNLEKFKENKD